MRGRTLGFPTANLVPESPLPLATGVYAARAEWEGRSVPAVVNIGVRPTFGESTPTIEAYLLDVSVDLYDRLLALSFVARIRDEMRFPSVDALKARIAEDVAAARRLLAGSAAPGES
jgi:riboflavin kinase/FMN adenylyltransferase